MAEIELTRELVRGLYEKHGAALEAYACCHGLDFASAEDAVQQVLLTEPMGARKRS